MHLEFERIVCALKFKAPDIFILINRLIIIIRCICHVPPNSTVISFRNYRCDIAVSMSINAARLHHLPSLSPLTSSTSKFSNDHEVFRTFSFCYATNEGSLLFCYSIFVIDLVCIASFNTSIFVFLADHYTPNILLPKQHLHCFYFLHVGLVIV